MALDLNVRSIVCSCRGDLNAAVSKLSAQHSTTNRAKRRQNTTHTTHTLLLEWFESSSIFRVQIDEGLEGSQAFPSSSRDLR